MSSIVGAWSLSGDPIESLLSSEERYRLRDSLPQGGTESRAETEGRLWLCAPDTKLESSPGLTVAGEGFFASPGLLEALDPERTPEGHYAMLWHDRRAEHLTLYRSLSGGERLYFAQPRPELLVFATSIWPLRSLLGARLERRVLNEVLLTGLTMFGSESLHQGIHEVLPGHQMRLDAGVGSQRFRNGEALRPPIGDEESLARDFRDKLTAAVAASAGPARPVAVALSGGIDSSAIAAAAVDAFGADSVHAITYEFDDPGHSTEVEYARMVATKLGIKRHDVFPLKVADYHAAIPEMVYRSESLVHWPKAFMLLVAREVKGLGYDRYLTGFGVGSHLSYLDELARALHRAPGLVTGHWKASRFGARVWPERLVRLHPSLEAPHPRLYYLLVKLLAARGMIKDPKHFFPSELHPLLDEEHAVGDEDMDLPLGPWLQRRALSRGIACIDVTRSEKASRELGVYRISPAHFDSCVPYAHFPYLPRPRLYGRARSLRPGKQLLRRAYQGVLPDAVLYREKSWGDAVASDSWLRTGRRLMLSVLPQFPYDFAEYGDHYPGTISTWESRSILASSLALRLWMRIFIELPQTREAPTWHELWMSLQEKRACA